MSEIKDAAFKLFGKTIPLPANDEIPAKHGDGDEDFVHQTKSEHDKRQSKQKTGESEEEDHTVCVPEDPVEQATSSGVSEGPNSNLTDKETSTAKHPRPDEEQNEKTTSQEKTMKKPDKVLPCPRCNSLDTKFCYYNNYNVSQPRHFCKNCQRYWTAGGTMRNVPVGAGRRKNKHSASHYRHITVPDGLQKARPDASDPVLHHPLNPNGTVLSFGPDAPLCESMASVLNLADKTIAKRNEFHITEDLKTTRAENGEEHSSGSSVTILNSIDEGNHANLQEPVLGNCQGFAPQVPCFAGAPWPYPWNASQWSTQPAFCASSFPVSFYPATYWGCAIPGAWSIPWLGTGGGLTSPHASPNTDSPKPAPSAPSSSSLGKHSREGDTLKQNNCENGDTFKQSNSERCLWIPKTLRIGDPDEAAKSSIWAMLGIKNDKADLISGGGMFKAFQSKMDEKNHMTDAAQVLNANPAALSRSLNFHENL